MIDVLPGRLRKRGMQLLALAVCITWLTDFSRADEFQQCIFAAELTEFEQRFVSWAFNSPMELEELTMRGSGLGTPHSVGITFGFAEFPVQRWELRTFLRGPEIPGFGLVSHNEMLTGSIETTIQALQSEKNRSRSRIGGVVGDALNAFVGRSDEPVGVLAFVSGSMIGASDTLVELERILSELENASQVDRIGAGTGCPVTRFRRGNRLGSTIVLIAENNPLRRQSCIAAGFFAHFGFSNPIAAHESGELVWSKPDESRSGLNLRYASYFARMYGNGGKLEGMRRGANACDVAERLVEQRAAFDR